MFFRFILWSIIFTVIVRFIRRFLLPLFQLTTAASHKVKEMQKQMDDMKRQETERRKTAPERGEYIDYEEVKS